MFRRRLRSLGRRRPAGSVRELGTDKYFALAGVLVALATKKG
jgi:hypothetical protein